LPRYRGWNKLPYDPQRDFIPLSLYATMPNILCVNPSLPVRSVSEFVKFIKANPGKYKYASSGVGASPHLTMELFKAVTGTDLVHVPYKVASQGYAETMMESGIPDFEVTVWQGYAMPKGTSKGHLVRIHAAMMKALASPDLKQRFFDNGVAAAPQTPDEFVKFISVEYAKWKKAVALSGAKVE